VTETLPETYDFNEHFTPLPILNQGQSPTCWFHGWATRLTAWLRCYEGRVVDISPDFTYSEPSACDYVFHTAAAGDLPVHTASCDRYWETRGGQSPDTIRAALIRNGCVEVTIASKDPHVNVWGRGAGLPVITPSAAPGTYDSDHDVAGVGYTPDGVIIQNSWGDYWAHGGRAIVSWDFLTAYSCYVNIYGFRDHPVDSLVLPTPRPAPPAPVPSPPPAPASRRIGMLIKSAKSPAVWLVLGGVRVWVPNAAVFHSQGFTYDEVQTRPDSDPLWHLPVVGPHPS